MNSVLDSHDLFVHDVSVVIPVYQGAKTLPRLFEELEVLTEHCRSPEGRTWRIAEAICVYDHGHDDSPDVLRALAKKYDWLRIIWLSRNFGQHPATMAGISATGSSWVATIDEDGQQDPRDIGTLLDAAVNNQATLVYAKPLNPPPHGFVRNLCSRAAKRLLDIFLGSHDSARYNSFRLILGEVARSASAYAGNGVYMDVALGWVAEVTTVGVSVREEGERTSGYSYRKLFAHFWRMVLSSGTRSLRIVSLLGLSTAIAGIAMAIFVLIHKIITPSVQIGWSSIIIAILVMGGLTLLSLGVIAEYLGVAVSMAMGHPLYLSTSDPALGPLRDVMPLNNHQRPDERP